MSRGNLDEKIALSSSGVLFLFAANSEGKRLRYKTTLESSSSIWRKEGYHTPWKRRGQGERIGGGGYGVDVGVVELVAE